MSVVLETSIGDLTVDLYLEQRPICCLNFLKLCKMKYFNFNLVFSVQRNFVAQMGDPTGTGRGGASVFKYVYGDQATYFDAEIKPRIKHTKAGMLSMVNNGSNQHGSQFFITLAPDLDYLDTQQHTVFGEVAEGFEVLEKLNEIIADKENRPYKDIRIFHTVVLDDPLKDPPGLEEHIPDRSPTPTKEQLDSIRIGVDEDVDDEKGRKPEELEEVYKEKEAKATAQILEMIGDLPEADVKPPDNVLFVCKLNPVTSAEDLEIIFSRFGEISSCEVIKDTKTNESLQYAFIEFKNVEDCEKAYFKMDNVLIDDRRIHVDFSQSVSKIKWKGKGKGVERIKEEKEVTQPQFRIKDPDKRVIDDKYGYVFEEDEDDRVSSKSAKKKHERHRSRSGSVDKSKVRRSRSSSSSKRHRDKKAKRKHGHSDKHRASRSNSPDGRSNSGSPHEHKKKKERLQDGHDDRKDRSERHAEKSRRRSCSPKRKSEDSKHKKHKHQDKERRR